MNTSLAKQHYRILCKLYYKYLFDLVVLVHQNPENHKEIEFLDVMCDSLLNGMRAITRHYAKTNVSLSWFHNLDAHFRELYIENCRGAHIEL